ncbi:hypothetical protein ACFLYO_08615 [Chloroflexota bacterium]
MVNIGNMGRKQGVPRVILAQRVVRKMAQGAALYPEEETAEALVGLVLPNDQGPPDFYVLDTIAPDWDATEREVAMVEQGDDLQDEIMYWLSINWRRFRQMRSQSYGNARAAKWNAPLRYLGDWHKQPGEMFWPSQGDLATAQAIVQDEANDMPQLLAPIVTVAPPWDEDSDPPGDDYDLYVIQDDGPRIRVNFWYLSRDSRQFVAARPEVQPDDLLPTLSPLAWHLTDRDRFQQEYDDLSNDGLAVSIIEWDADEQPPLEICFMAGRMGGSHVLILITDKNYPQVAPTVRLAPMMTVGEDEDLFKTLWDESIIYATAGLPDWTWSPEMALLDLVRAVEAQL